jgi:hypothetical protein
MFVILNGYAAFRKTVVFLSPGRESSYRNVFSKNIVTFPGVMVKNVS